MNQFYSILSIWIKSFILGCTLMMPSSVYALETFQDEDASLQKILKSDDLLVPVLDSPANYSWFNSDVNEVSLAWHLDETAGITSLKIEYYINGVLQPLVTGLSSADVTYSLTGLTSGSFVSWRVGSVDGSTIEHWSESFEFSIKRDRKVYVKPDGVGDGASWNTATNLRSALSNYVYGDTLWLTKGVYKPTSSLDRTIRFELKEGIHIYGGFVGYETSLDQRDWSTNVTVLSGDIGEVDSNTDNSYNLLWLDGRDNPVTNLTRIDGLVVEEANAALSSGSRSQGSAMQLLSASPLVVNVWFRDNHAATYGGAVYADGNSIPLIYNCIFEDNEADNWGGAIMTEGSPIIGNSVFYGNIAGGRGGAISAPELPHVVSVYNSVLWNNEAPTGSQTYGTVDVSNSVIEGGEASLGNKTTDPLFVNPSEGDFRITKSSPALNGGDNDDVPAWLTFDFSGSNRILATNVDMGVFEGITEVPVIEFPVNQQVLDYDLSSIDLQWGWESAAPDDLIGYEIQYILDGGETVSIDAGTSLTWPFTDIQVGSEVDWRVGATVSGSSLILWSNWSSFIIRRDKPLYVKSGATGTGSSWSDPISLKDAMDVAVFGDQIWVATGIYKPTDDTDRFVSFGLRDGIKLYGGFVGNETSLDQRNFLSNLTIFSGNIGETSTSDDNSYRVFKIEGTAQDPITNNTCIDGIIIEDGYASSANNNSSNGGGMYLNFASPVITNVLFRNNRASENGGAVYCDEYSQPVFGNIIFSNNSAVKLGGAVYINTKNAVYFYNCLWYKNSSEYWGGAISASINAAVIYNSILWGNTAAVEFSDIDYANAYSSLVQDGSGTASLTDNPLLTDPVNLDFTPKSGSPAIDSGDNSYVADWLEEDFYGNRRIYGTAVDMGPIEQGSIPDALINPETSALNNLQIWPNPVKIGENLFARVGYQNSPGTLSLYNFSGSIVSQWTILSGETHSLGHVSLTSGIYILRYADSLGHTTSVTLVVK
ncbi:choice-of-anchor Q domain-containing protein [Geofilum sp. OHC36d9]|uniref:choice-of-anchor Q domain-containing protein n=1 Tax=Geofilum sp. OHC36d9 TaxID=3458413 RepID=UPI00403420C6